jgi:hypothetical protein
VSGGSKLEFRLAVTAFLISIETPLLFFLILSIKQTGLTPYLFQSFGPPIIVPLLAVGIFMILRRIVAPRFDLSPYFTPLVALPIIGLAIAWTFLGLSSSPDFD